jgi:antirestriction protein ArdC
MGNKFEVDSQLKYLTKDGKSIEISYAELVSEVPIVPKDRDPVAMFKKWLSLVTIDRREMDKLTTLTPALKYRICLLHD